MKTLYNSFTLKEERGHFDGYLYPRNLFEKFQTTREGVMTSVVRTGVGDKVCVWTLKVGGVIEYGRAPRLGSDGRRSFVKLPG